MTDQDDPRLDDQQDAAGGADEAADATDLEVRPGEPGYVATRLERIKGQRDAARLEAASKDGELRALNARLAALESRASQPGPAEKQAPTLDDEFGMAKDFIRKVEANRLIIDTSDDEVQVKAARQQLAGIRSDDIAFAHAEMARLSSLKAAAESEKKISTQVDGRAAQAAFNERLKAEFGPDAVNNKSELFQSAIAEYRELIQSFPDDSGGAVTWMALKEARSKMQNRGGRLSDKDTRRLAIEGQTRREGQFANTIAALEAKGDQTSKGKAADLKLDAFLQHHYAKR